MQILIKNEIRTFFIDCIVGQMNAHIITVNF